MPMSKKIYEEIAAVIKSKWDSRCAACYCSEPWLIIEMRDELAAILLADNPRFNVAKFNEACGIQEEWITTMASPL